MPPLFINRKHDGGFSLTGVTNSKILSAAASLSFPLMAGRPLSSRLINSISMKLCPSRTSNGQDNSLKALRIVESANFLFIKEITSSWVSHLPRRSANIRATIAIGLGPLRFLLGNKCSNRCSKVAIRIHCYFFYRSLYTLGISSLYIFAPNNVWAWHC